MYSSTSSVRLQCDLLYLASCAIRVTMPLCGRSLANIVFVFMKGAFVAKIFFFCFLSEKECLDGMEPVYIFCFFL